jgi:hypothetical protein
MKKRRNKSLLRYHIATCYYKTTSLAYQLLFIVFLRGFNARFVLGKINSYLLLYGAKEAKKFIARRYIFFRPACLTFLLKLMDIILEDYPIRLASSSTRKKFLIHLCCWGHNYTNKAEYYLLNSLLADNNVPYLIKNYDVTILIDCDTSSQSSLNLASCVLSLRSLCNVEIRALPESLYKHLVASTNYPNAPVFRQLNKDNNTLKYALLGALQAKALVLANMHDALISFLIPDSVLSDKFYLNLCTKIKARKLVLSSTFRTQFTAARPDIEKYRTSNNAISISAQAMTDLQIQHLHPTDKRRILSEKTVDYLPCARLIFQSSRGLIMRAFHYHPTLIDTKNISLAFFKISCSPIDDTVMSRILSNDQPYEDQVWLCNDSSYANFMELSDDEPLALEPKLMENVLNNYDNLLTKIVNLVINSGAAFNNNANHFFLKNRMVFNSTTSNHHKDTIDDRTFIKDLYTRISKQQCQ